MDKKIIYFGDSFCAHPGTIPGTHQYVVKEAFPDHDVIVHGYGGASWFYSRYRMLNESGHFFAPENRKNITAMIFFHTDGYRINAKQLIYFHQLSKSSTTWFDGDFQDWAQEQWFTELTKDFSDIPTIHFHNFSSTLPRANLLSGMQFTTPLMSIAVGELTGTDDEIMAKLNENETRHNHLSAQNNTILGEFIVDAIKNYQTGKFPINLSKFNIVNPNGYKYPNPGFGTK
jgi:hypothetical protein